MPASRNNLKLARRDTRPLDAELVDMEEFPTPAKQKMLGEFAADSDRWQQPPPAQSESRLSQALGNAAESLGSALGKAVGTVEAFFRYFPYREFWQLSVKWFKLAVCIFLDILDCFIGRILGFGFLFDVGCALICAALWGNRGWYALWEVVDVTEQIDGFCPTCTIIAIRAWND